MILKEQSWPIIFWDSAHGVFERPLSPSISRECVVRESCRPGKDLMSVPLLKMDSLEMVSLWPLS